MNQHPSVEAVILEESLSDEGRECRHVSFVRVRKVR